MKMNVKLLSLSFILFAGLFIVSCANEAGSDAADAADAATETLTDAASGLSTSPAGNNAISARSDAAQANPVNAGPTTSVKFEKPTHDFGTVTAGETVTYKYKFTNTGNEPLIISNVKASCGCTTPSYTKEPVSPGETGYIDVQYRASGNGNVTKNVTITANTTPAKTMIYLKANVEPKAK